MYHVRHRVYDPSAGRFLQRDPIGYAGGINLYMYVGNIPYGFVDPMGLEPNWHHELVDGIFQSGGWLDTALGLVIPGLTTAAEGLRVKSSGV